MQPSGIRLQRPSLVGFAAGKGERLFCVHSYLQPCRVEPKSPATPWQRRVRVSAAAQDAAHRPLAGRKRPRDDAAAALDQEAALAKQLGRHVRHAARYAARCTSAPPSQQLCTDDAVSVTASIIVDIFLQETGFSAPMSSCCRLAAELSSDDEQHFQNKETRRLQADKDALRPVMLGGN